MQRRLVIVGLAVVGCGDDVQGGGDASSPDAALACRYTEAMDQTNGDASEPTSLTLASTLRICGQIDAKAPSGSLVDRDRFEITLGPMTSHLLTVTAPQGAALDRIGVELRQPNVFWDSAILVPDRASILLNTTYPAGPMEIHVLGTNSTQPSAAVPYAISLETIDVTRCPPGSSPDYTEAADGVNNSDNDAVEVRFNNAYVTTQTMASDAAEPTNLTIAPGSHITIDGEAGLNTMHSDLYRDRDTYLIATAAGTSSLALRVTWDDVAGSADDSDLDVMVFPVPADATAPVPRLAGGNTTNSAGSELTFAAAQPSTMYWVLVASAAATGVVKPYRLTVCGS